MDQHRFGLFLNTHKQEVKRASFSDGVTTLGFMVIVHDDEGEDDEDDDDEEEEDDDDDDDDDQAHNGDSDSCDGGVEDVEEDIEDDHSASSCCTQYTVFQAITSRQIQHGKKKQEAIPKRKLILQTLCLRAFVCFREAILSHVYLGSTPHPVTATTRNIFHF